MASPGKLAAPERAQTNESLRVEREQTDHALHEKREAELAADVVVDRAREHADAVLEVARDKADDAAHRVEPRPSVAARRADEDAAVLELRDTADERLRRERAESAQALSKLLPLEREKTDRFLLTERDQSDDALSNRDGFLGIVSHDLRNLLAGIVISAARLGESADDDEQHKTVRWGANRIRGYAARMNRLIGDLLDLVSIDAGRLSLARAPGDMAALIAEAVTMFQPGAVERGVSLEAELEPALHCEFDRDRILQVLANLLTNAIKFSTDGGRIRVHGVRRGDELRFSVSDTGAGIPDDLLEGIFERFSQIATDERRGVGLGLYVSRYLVEAHGGRIWAESTAAGSTVWFTLPCAPTVAAP